MGRVIRLCVCPTQLSTTSATCTTAWSSPSTWAVISSRMRASAALRVGEQQRSPAHLHGAGGATKADWWKGGTAFGERLVKGWGTSWTGQGNSLWEGHVDTTLPPPCRFTVASRALDGRARHPYSQCHHLRGGGINHGGRQVHKCTNYTPLLRMGDQRVHALGKASLACPAQEVPMSSGSQPEGGLEAADFSDRAGSWSSGDSYLAKPILLSAAIVVAITGAS